MKNKLPFSSTSLNALTLSVAEVELNHARNLAWLLPETASFEEQCNIGLEIGEAGRRVKTLLEVTGEKSINKIAPSPFDSHKKRQAHHSQPHSKTKTYDFFYQSLLEHVQPLGFMAHRYRIVFLDCQRSHQKSNRELPSWLNLSKERIISDLLKISTTRKSRIEPHLVQGRRGNSNKKYDPRWNILPLWAEIPRMKRTNTREGLLHKLHHTALRETLAAEAASLNFLEYDGLPWDFYIDMTLQTEDEIRHSLICLDRLHSLGGKMGQFPVSSLGNCYHMFWEMDLTERLVTMNLDTETPSLTYLNSLVKQFKVKGDTKTATLFDFVNSDEQRHAQIGAKWFRFLYPDPIERRDALQTVRALIPVYLASAAHTTGGNVSTMLDCWLANGNIINFNEPSDDRHEKEVSLLSARTKKQAFMPSENIQKKLSSIC